MTERFFALLCLLLGVLLLGCSGTMTEHRASTDDASTDAGTDTEPVDATADAACTYGNWYPCEAAAWWPACSAGYQQECLDGGLKSCVCETETTNGK